jgi:hypothetical protein
MEIKDLSLTVVGLCGIYAGSAVAIEPASISAGAIDIIPQLSVQLIHNDNIFSTETNEKDSLITVINPSVQFIAEKENDAYRVTADVKHGIYDSSSADNYTDKSLTAEAIMELNSRNRLNVTAAVAKLHEDRGSNNATTGDKPSRYTDKSIAATYLFGAESAQGNVELAASYLDHQYDNFTNLNAGRDRDNTRLGATFYYRVAPKTRALFEVRHEDIDYDLSTSTLDNTEKKYLVGVTWDATAKTSGTAKVGYSEKDYDSAAREDQDGASWEIGVRWEPKTYSAFDLVASQEYEEASGNEDAIDTENLTLSWSHSWSKMTSTQAMIGHMVEDYSGLSREDTTDSLMLGVNYELRRWLALNLSYTYSDTDSDVAGESSTQNLFMLTMTGSL